MDGTLRGETTGGRSRGARRRYWTEHVERWRRSGVTQKAYCEEEGLSRERFGSWKRRLEKEEGSRSGLSLVPVPAGIVSSALCTRPRLGVVVKDCYRVEVADGFSPATLESVIRVLERL